MLLREDERLLERAMTQKEVLSWRYLFFERAQHSVKKKEVGEERGLPRRRVVGLLWWKGYLESGASAVLF